MLRQNILLLTVWFSRFKVIRYRQSDKQATFLCRIKNNSFLVLITIFIVFLSSQAPPIPEDVHTDELTTISQDRWIVDNHKPPKISLLKANFSQSEKIDFSNNSKSLMPKSVAGIIPAVITPASTTVLPSTTTVPETQQQSSNKKFYKKCCQERQVVHLGKFHILNVEKSLNCIV